MCPTLLLSNLFTEAGSRKVAAFPQQKQHFLKNPPVFVQCHHRALFHTTNFPQAVEENNEEEPPPCPERDCTTLDSAWLLTVAPSA